MKHVETFLSVLLRIGSCWNLVFFVIALGCRPASAQAVEVQDSLALVAFYNATNGPNWTDNTNWLTGPISTWAGIFVFGGRVVQIRLVNNQLSGEIPPEFANLTGLTNINFLLNQLSGQIPQELENLSNLVALNLARNQFTGPIPLWIVNLQNLVTLNLSENQLSGEIPPELSNLTNLGALSLSLNPLSGEIPPELGNLTNLQSLYLIANQLSGQIPATLENLANLQVLELDANQFSGEIPSWLSNLTNLKDLNLARNNFSGEIPPELGNLTNLEDLWLFENQLSGEIPNELGHLSNLREIDLLSNELTGSIPAALGNLAELTFLRIAANQLSGVIPAELGNLTHLESLELGNNQLNESIPRELGNLTKLRGLSLGRNQLSGPIPSELGNLTNLVSLQLGQNQLSGTIPPELGNLAGLGTIILENNAFTGSLPLSFVNMVRLTSLRFSNTNLCEPSELPFQSWLSSINTVISTNVTCTSTGSADLLSLDPQQTGSFNLQQAGTRISVSQPSTTEGLISATLVLRTPSNVEALSSITVESTTGAIVPDVVSPHRYWLVFGANLNNITYDICLDVSTLPKINHPDRLVVVKRDNTLEDWIPLNSATEKVGSTTYVCANGLTSFSHFGIASEAVSNPLPTDEETSLPRTYHLSSAYPNPFNPITTITFTLPRRSEARLTVYDLLGREVEVLADGPHPAGHFEVVWDGVGYASGMYLYRLEAGPFSASKQMILQK